MLGGVLYFAMFGATVLLCDVLAERAKGTFFGQHAFTHMLDVTAFALLLIGTVGVYLYQSGQLSKVGKAGSYLTAAGSRWPGAELFFTIVFFIMLFVILNSVAFVYFSG